MDSLKPVVASNEHLGGNSTTAPSAKQASLATNLAWRALANWSSQIVSSTALLIVVRLLSPSDFGLVGMSAILYWYLKFLGEFGITTTVIRHRDLSEETLAQLNTVSAAFGVGTFLLGCLLAWPTAVFFKTPRLAPVVIVTCTALIPLGLRNVPEGLMNTEMRFKSLSLFDALRDIVSAAVTVLLAWLGFHYWALILGNLLSEVTRCAVILGVRAHRFAWPRMATVREPLTFGRRVLVSSVAWSTYNTLDNVTAGRILGRAALGLYGMAWNLANMPLEKITSLVTTLVPAYLSRAQTDLAALRHYVRALSEMIALAAFPTTIGLALVANEAVPLVMGSKWSGMIAPLQVLCVYTAIRSVVALLPKVLIAVGHARFVMRAELAGLVLMPTAFWIGSHWGIRGIAFGWVFAYPIIALVEYWKTLTSIKMKRWDYIGAVRPALDGCIAMVVAIGLFKWVVPLSVSPMLRLIVEVAGGAVVYISTVMVLHRERAMYFLSAANRMRRPKLAPEADAVGT